MADRPIIFSAPMILALLAGRKTQTRRILKPQPRADARYSGVHYDSGEAPSWFFNAPGGPLKIRERFAPGDRLYVRENIIKTASSVAYAADAGDAFAGAKPKITPCIHMPRTASRMTLIVTEVRVERLQDISEADAIAEGIFAIRGPDKDGMRHFAAGAGEKVTRPTPERAFAELWQAINGHESWDANPWVAAVSFEMIARNIDDLPIPA